MTLKQYIIISLNDLPLWFYLLTFFVFVISNIYILCFASRNVVTCWIARVFLLLFLVILFSSTVFFRPIQVERVYNFTPFWSYYAIGPSRPDLIYEIIFNVILFFPLGFAFAFAISSPKWWQPLVIGLLLSFSIESLQFIFKSGFSEIDDIIHNTIGSLTGYGFFLLLVWIHRCSMKLYRLVLGNDHVSQNVPQMMSGGCFTRWLKSKLLQVCH